jgi:ATP-dependent DNA helicase RecG
VSERAVTIDLGTAVQWVKGIGPRRSAQLAEHGIRTVGDLVEYLPFRYEDRTALRPLAGVREGEWALVGGVVRSVHGFDTRRQGLAVVEFVLADATGEATVTFFNQPYLRQVLKPGIRVVLYGLARRDEHRAGRAAFVGPEYEVVDDEAGPTVHSGRVVPIYRKLGELRSRTLRRILFGLLERLGPDAVDPLPAYLRRELRLPPRAAALAAVHFPPLRAGPPEARVRELDAYQRGLSPAHKRFIFEELFQLQVALLLARRRRAAVRKDRTLVVGPAVREAIKAILPFHPTAAQKRVLREIADDLRGPQPMSRLLQGDVGSGKTIVAAQAAVVLVENGYQVAFMAPTEILAEQHYLYLRRLLAPLGYEIGLLKGSLRARARRAVIEGVATGRTRVAVGTHALIQEGVAFHRLGFVVIDEQHRFGVVEREALRAKGDRPDVLVMTATPIPRSLALTLYGDLDVSVLDELPPGRQPVRTEWLREGERDRVYGAIRETVRRGEQAYVVYPLVEESAKSDLKAATEMARRLAEEVFPEIPVALLHGRMRTDEKERAMGGFAAGEVPILVATTVIEVGVDVPNATLMVIEHAERFGLAQLHQLRGRVGRGRAPSRCLLVAGTPPEGDAARRLEILCQSNDGFRIAEVDLELRGPGEVIGTRQSGLPLFKFTDLVRDRKALEVARREAERFVANLRRGPDAEARRVARLVDERWAGRAGMVAG